MFLDCATIRHKKDRRSTLDIKLLVFRQRAAIPVQSVRYAPSA